MKKTYFNALIIMAVISWKNVPGLQDDWVGLFSKYIMCADLDSAIFIKECFKKNSSKFKSITLIFYELDFYDGSKRRVDFFRNDKIGFLEREIKKIIKIQNYRVDKSYTRLADIYYEVVFSKKNTEIGILVTYLLEEGEWKVNQITWCGREDVCETEEEKRFKKKFWLTVEKYNK